MVGGSKAENEEEKEKEEHQEQEETKNIKKHVPKIRVVPRCVCVCTVITLSK